MTKLDIIQQVHKAAEITEPEAAQLVEFVLNLLKTTLKQGEQIIIVGFGTFTVRRKRARQGRNPRTGQPVLISQRTVVTFRASPLWKKYVNEEESRTGTEARGDTSSLVAKSP
jgi:integration host factor subunit alpha